MEEKIEVWKIGDGEILFGNLEYDPERGGEFYSCLFQNLIDSILLNFGSVINCFMDMGDDNIGPASVMESVLRDSSLQIEEILEFLETALGKIEFKFRLANGASASIPYPVAVRFIPSEYLKKGIFP